MNKTSKLLLFSLLCFVITAFTTNRHHYPSSIAEMVKIFENEAIEFSIENISTAEVITSSYNSDLNDFQLNTANKISFIQVMDSEHNLLFQLPVQTKNLHLFLDDFERGLFHMAIKFENLENFVFASFSKKEG